MASASSRSAPITQPYHKHVTISFWSWVPGIDKAVAAFEKAYPTIHVKLLNVGAGLTGEYPKLITALEAHKGAPDVVQIEYYELPTIVRTGGILNLSKLGANRYQKDFFPWAWHQVAFQGGIYSIPQDQGPLALLYNASLFKRYHLTVPKTWAEFSADAAKFHNAAPSLYFNIDINPANSALLTALAWAANGQLAFYSNGQWQFPVTSPAWKKTLSLWQNMAYKGWVSDNVPGFSIQSNSLFAHDKVATEIAAAWSPALLEGVAPKSSGQWRVAPLPSWNPKVPVSGDWGGSSDAVTVQSKHPHASLLLATWLNTNQTAMSLDWLNGGLYPADIAGTRLAAISSPWRYFGGQRIGSVFSEAATHINQNFLWPPVVNYFDLQWSDLLTKAVQAHGSWTATLPQIQMDLQQYARTSGVN